MTNQPDQSERPDRYRSLYERGQFDKLLQLARRDRSDQGNFWRMIASFNLGDIDGAREVVREYDTFFSKVSDPELRKNFNHVANHLRDRKIERTDKTGIEDHLVKVFSGIVDEPLQVERRGSFSRKSINLGSHYCRFTRNPDKFDKLRREFDLLQSIQGKVSFMTPNPISFEVTDYWPEGEEQGKVAAYIYRKLPGKSMSNKFSLSGLLDVILELQQLHQHSEIRQHLIEFTPELDQIRRQLTAESMLARFDRMKQTTIDGVLAFIDLCTDHLPVDPERRTFVHGDLFSGNIIYNGDPPTIAGVIDFERGWYADPWLDFSKLTYNDDHLKGILGIYDQEVESIDIDVIMGRVLLYRGMFILRRLLNESPRLFLSKIDMWVINPIPKIGQLLE